MFISPPSRLFFPHLCCFVTYVSLFYKVPRLEFTVVNRTKFPILFLTGTLGPYSIVEIPLFYLFGVGANSSALSSPTELCQGELVKELWT